MADLLSTTITRLTKSEEERRAFIGSISHDLRTPLSIARGYTETLMLKREKGDVTAEEQNYYSGIIYAKMLQIENMVKQLFELSKIESVAFTPNKEPFILSEIVQESINTFQMMAAEKKVELKCAQCLYHVWISADISMMERLLQNLIENALKNTPEGGFIHASMSVVEKDLIFEIRNSGDPLHHDLSQWINNYKDESALLSKRPSQSGLGLLIVQKILVLHGTSLKTRYLDGKNIFSFHMPVFDRSV